MDDKKKLTDDELEKVTGGTDCDLFYEKEDEDHPYESELADVWPQKDKTDDILPSDKEYAKLPK